MKYTGPLGKGYSGDKTKAMSLQGAARLLVQQTINRLKAPPFDGRGYLVQHKKLADGSRLHALVNMIGGAPVIRTWIESPSLIDSSSTIQLITTYIISENGLLTLVAAEEDEDSNIIPALAQMYLSSDSAAYFSANKTRFGTKAYTHLQGKISVRAEVGAALDWEGSKSSIDASSPSTLAGADDYETEYHWQSYLAGDITLANFDPIAIIIAQTKGINASEDRIDGTYSISSMYTGLLRRAVQAKLALEHTVGADDGELRFPHHLLFPWGIGTPYVGEVESAYKHCGLFRTSDYDYVMVKITNAGCKACRMESATSVRDLKKRLAAGEFTGSEEADRVESILMSTLLPARTDSGELDEKTVLSFELEGDPLAYGWHFSYPPSHKASIVLHEEEWYEDGVFPTKTNKARTITVEFGISINGKSWSVSANLSGLSGEPDEWAPDANLLYLWLPTIFQGSIETQDASHRSWRTDFSTSTPVDAVIYGYYEEDSSSFKEVRIKLDKTAERTSERIYSHSYEERVSRCMPLDSVSETRPSSYVTPHEAFYSIGGDKVGNDSVLVGGYTKYELSSNIGGGSEGEPYTFSYSLIPYTYTCAGGEAIPVSQPSSGTCYIYPSRGTLVATYEITRTGIYIGDPAYPRAVTPFSKALIIPRLNSEAVVLVSRESTLVERHELRSKTIDNAGVSERRVYADGTTVNRNLGFSLAYDSWGLRSGTQFVADGCTNLLSLYVLSTTADSILIEPDETITHDREAKLFTSSGSKSLTYSAEADWDMYMFWNMDKDFVGFSAQESVGRKIILPQSGETGSEYEIDSGFAEGFVPGKVRWVGWE